MKAFYRTTSLLCVFLVIFVLFSGIAAADSEITGYHSDDSVHYGESNALVTHSTTNEYWWPGAPTNHHFKENK